MSSGSSNRIFSGRGGGIEEELPFIKKIYIEPFLLSPTATCDGKRIIFFISN